MKNLKNILRQQISLLGMLGILVIWQVMGCLKLLPKFILPTPLEIGQAFIRDAGFLASHSWVTLKVALLGLAWLGYGILPKIVLIILTTTFPIIVSILDGFRHCDRDTLTLFELMQANRWQILWHFKIPASLPYFYAGLRVSVSYAFITTVVSEWLGGFEGLGVYMIQSKKLFQYDTMFAIIILVSVISLLGMKLVAVSEKYVIKWK